MDQFFPFVANELKFVVLQMQKNGPFGKSGKRFFGTSKMGRKVLKNAKELLREQKRNESPTKATENRREKSF
jgi:hypothetical protein